jgi:hypothetical protein
MNTPVIPINQQSEKQCVLCGTLNERLVPFYLRTFSHQRLGDQTNVQFRDFRAFSCSRCFRKVSLLQSGKALSFVLMGPLALVGSYAWLCDKTGNSGNGPSGTTVAVCGVVFVVGLVTNIVTFFKRESLVENPKSVKSVITQARQLHSKATGFTPDRIIAAPRSPSGVTILDLNS